jgi:2-keto-4-pentenoate hydratase/2-oxohepta-3-ene-1,7-dioic acid hydratase in catechol pathway
MDDAIEDSIFANCISDGTPIVAVQLQGKLHDLSAAIKTVGAEQICSTDQIISGVLAPEMISAALRNARAYPLQDDVQFRPAILAPQKIVMVGLNYRKHVEETGNPIPDSPVLFGKFNNSLAGHGEAIRLPTEHANWFDYEAELVIVIGRAAHDVSEQNALDYVAGYCAGNDLSARDLQRRTSQMLLGKSLDGFAPLGPFLVGKSRVPNPDNLTIECSINGQLRQSSNTGDMIFNCRSLVSYISRYMTLLAGDLIFTGTPEGVAAGYPQGRQPWLVAGDRVDVTIEHLGTLRNVMC